MFCMMVVNEPGERIGASDRTKIAYISHCHIKHKRCENLSHFFLTTTIVEVI